MLPVLSDLHQLLNQSRGSELDGTEFSEVLTRLQERGYLAGIVCEGESIFVVEEAFGWKSRLFTEPKTKIADRAARCVESGNIVTLDSGSTTLEIAREIGHRVRIGLLHDLTIVTNSILAAQELLSVASRLGLHDDNHVLQVYVVGGRIRCNTVAIVTDERDITSNGRVAFADMLEKLGGGDVGFVGTNGISQESGFTTESLSETRTKQAMLAGSKKKYIVSDPSKFGRRQSNAFAGLDEHIEIITTRDGHARPLSDYETWFKDTSTTVIYTE